MADENDETSDELKAQVAEAAGLPQVREILDMSLDLNRDEKLRATALMMAVSYHKETIVKDGAMYQTMTAQGKNLRTTDPKQVVDAALIFEGYLRGHYSELMTQIALGVVHALDDAFRDDDAGQAAPDSDSAPAA